MLRIKWRKHPEAKVRLSISASSVFNTETCIWSRISRMGARHASQRSIFPNPVFLSPLFLMYVLRTALRVLRSPEEKTWILSKLDELSKA